jgi:hypothetical protein
MLMTRNGTGAGSFEVLVPSRLDVDQARHHLHQPDAVGERVMELHHHRGRAALEALDDAQLPERSRAIEALHGERLERVEELAHGAGAAARSKRTWKPSSKSGSTSQRGGAIEKGLAATRSRRRGTTRVACSAFSRRPARPARDRAGSGS